MADALASLARSICSLWQEKLKAARDVREDFDKIGDLLMRFYTEVSGKYVLSEGFAGALDIDVPLDDSRFPLKSDPVSELVDLMGPMIYSTNPVRTLNPRERWQPERGDFWIDENEKQIRAGQRSLVEGVLNYTPDEMGLKRESRRAIVDALIRGRGCLWLTTVRRPSGLRVITHRHEPIKRLYIDPDADTIESAWWVARLRIEPEWRVRRQFDIPDDVDIKSSMASSGQTGSEDEERVNRLSGEKHTKDVVAYFEIWSKMGLGGRFRDAPQPLKSFEKELRRHADELGKSAENVWLCIPISGGLNRPLNLPFNQDREEGLTRLQWPIDLWHDDRWPVQVLDLHDSGASRSSSLWPRSHLHSVLGEIFLDSFVMSRIAHKTWFSTRELIGVAQSLFEQLAETIRSGKDLTIMPVPTDQMARLDALIGHIPGGGPLPIDLAAVKALNKQEMERRTGVTEMMAGLQGRSPKTVAEAETRREMSRIRPDDLADRGEDWQSQVARNEYHAVRRLLEGKDVLGLFGQRGAEFWDQYVRTESVAQSAAEFECRIESGTARKPNKSKEIDDVQNLLRFALAPALSWAAQTGNTSSANWIMEQAMRAMDMERPPGGIFFSPPPQPPPQAGPAGQASSPAVPQGGAVGAAELPSEAQSAQAQAQAQPQNGQQAQPMLPGMEQPGDTDAAMMARLLAASGVDPRNLM